MTDFAGFFSGFLIFILLLGLLLVLHVLEGRWFFRRRFAELQTFAYPEAVVRRFRQAHPHLSSEQVRQVFLALTQFFSACFVYRFGWLKGQPRNRHGIGMPSRLADEAWHAYLLHTKDYQVFAKRFFKGRLDHTPDTPDRPVAFPTQASQRRYKADVLNTWLTFKAMAEHRLMAFTGLPLLFTLDAKFQVADGFFYTLADIPYLDGQALAMPLSPGDIPASGSGCGSGCSSCSTSSACAGGHGGGADGDGDGGGGGCGGD